MNGIPHDQRPAVEMRSAGWAAPTTGVRFPFLGMILLSAWAGAAGAAVAPPPHAVAAPARGFNFAYRSEGGRLAAPTQIFDDGHRTYMQFNALDHVPELWNDDGKGRGDARRLAFHLESPYVVIDQVLPQLRLTLDGQNTVLINQAWAARSAPHATATHPRPPRIWVDRTPFGPDQLPGPVATARETLPSREPSPSVNRQLAQQGVRHPGPAAGARNLTAAGAGGAEPAPPDAHRAAAAAAAAASADADADVGADGDSADTPSAIAPVAAAAVIQADQRTVVPDSDAEAGLRIEKLRARALSMVEQARDAGDRKLEQHLRQIFSDLALFPDDGPDGGDDRRMHHPPRYALAETRSRSDAPLAEDSDVETPRTVPRPAEPGLPAGPRSAAAAGDTRAAVAAVTGRGAAAAAPATGGMATGAGAASGVPELTFEVRDNQRLSQALGQFLEAQGWRLEWESQSDFLVRRGYVVRAPDVRQVLLQALGGYRLSAVMYTGNLVVAVSGGEP